MVAGPHDQATRWLVLVTATRCFDVGCFDLQQGTFTTAGVSASITFLEVPISLDRGSV